MLHVNYISIELEEENFCVEFEKPLRHSEKKGKQYFFKSGAGKEIRGLQCLSGKESTCKSRRPRRCGLDPWVGKIPWRRERLPTPVFWPGEFHELCSPWDRKESDRTERLWFSLNSYFHMDSFRMEKKMAAHSSILAWRTPWTEEPGRLHGVKGVRYNLATKPPAAAAQWNI